LQLVLIVRLLWVKVRHIVNVSDKVQC
jgi:hypothetical protein